MLFVDADITFTPDQVTRLLAFDKEFVAGLYPAKVIDWQAAGAAFRRSAETLDEAGLVYVGALCEGVAAKTENGFATAFMPEPVFS